MATNTTTTCPCLQTLLQYYRPHNNLVDVWQPPSSRQNLAAPLCNIAQHGMAKGSPESQDWGEVSAGGHSQVREGG